MGLLGPTQVALTPSGLRFHRIARGARVIPYGSFAIRVIELKVPSLGSSVWLVDSKETGRRLAGFTLAAFGPDLPTLLWEAERRTPI